MDTPKQRGKQPTDRNKAALTRSAIWEAQTICVPPMAKVSVLGRCLLPGLVHTEPEHVVFLNHSLQLNKGIDEKDQDKPPIVVVANFSNVTQTIPKHMLLELSTRSHTLLLPAKSPLVAHNTAAFLYVPICEPDVIQESPTTTANTKPPHPRERLLKTPVVFATGPVVSKSFAHIYGQANTAELPEDWRDLVDLSDIVDDAHRKYILPIL